MKELARHYLKDPMDRLIAIQMESPILKDGKNKESIGRMVDRYDFNFLYQYAVKAIEKGLKP